MSYQSQQGERAFQKRTDALAHHVVGMFIATDVPPVMASLVASQIIRAVLLDLAETNRPLAKALLEELARGLVEFCAELGVNPELNGKVKARASGK
jgi:hypothetical protein